MTFRSFIHFGVGTIITVTLSISGHEAKAQAFENLQSTIDTIRPVTPQEPIQRAKPKSDPNVRIGPSTGGQLQEMNLVIEGASSIRKRDRAPAATTPEERPIVIEASTTLNIAYDSNATKSNTSAARLTDMFLGITNAASIKVPVGTDDTIAFNVGTTSLRYNKLAGLDGDQISNGIRYLTQFNVKKLSGYDTPGTTTRTLVNFGVDNDIAMVPTFGDSGLIQYRPTFIVQRSNMQLGNALCGPENNKSFCDYLTVTGTAHYNLANVVTSDHALIRVGAERGWRTNNPAVNYSLTGRLAARTYTDVVGGRDDLIADLTAKYTYAFSNNLVFTASVTGVQQWSTVEVRNWSGYTLVPAITLQGKW